MREPRRYAPLKAAHEAALEERAETRVPAEPARAPDNAPDLGEQIEARLAAYDFVQWPRVDAGLITPTEYANRRLQLDQDLAREVQGLPTRTEFEPAGDAPTKSAEQFREAKINPDVTPAERQVEEKVERLSHGREVSEASRARIDRLMESTSNELEMRHEQEIGGPSRGRGR